VADATVPIEQVVAPTTAPDDVLRVEHITKGFGPVTALRDVSLHLKKGEVLGLLGDNGAGKSTLIKILCGFQRQDSGTMWLKGERYEPKSVDNARALGVDVVYQDLALIDELTVYQNMFLCREQRISRLPFLDARRMKRETRKSLDDIGINLPRLDVPVARLSGGQRQSIAVARGVYSDADILLLDEPLAAMGAKEGAMILELIARLKEEGKLSIIMILHNYVHVLESCDRVNIVVDEYRRARAAAQAEDAARVASSPSTADYD
jgi:ABC-type sugar transport system ATPase subunit